MTSAYLPLATRHLPPHLMRILGVLNHKGGTGKTTTVVNLASGLAMRGARVLIIDLDAQGSVATSLGISYTSGLPQLMLGAARLENCIYPARDNLDIIPSDRKLMEVEGMLWQMNDRTAARQFLSQTMEPLSGYDYVVIDYSPSASLLGQSGLLFSDELLVPVSMDYMALMGTRQVIETLKEIGRIPDHHLRLSLIVPTFYYGRLRKDREVLTALHRYFSGKVADPIRSNVKVAEAPGHHQTIYEYAPRSIGAKDYAQLVERIADDGTKSR